MFGESESESPRVGSPWEAIISNSGAGSPSSLLRLVPEAEEVRLQRTCIPASLNLTILQGNCEYKLQLLSPSPSRLARLITQLKWRLLEGGGQALYQIGVADSGTLIGLTRPDLERSLETLEVMAGEIGASVIVVREVEVRGGAEGGVTHSTDLGLDEWNRRRGYHTIKPSSSTVQTAWGPAIKDMVDTDADEGTTTETDADTDADESSKAPTDSDTPGMFSMDIEPSVTFALAISSVYKPRTPSASPSPALTPSSQQSGRRNKKPPNPLYQKPKNFETGEKTQTKGEAKALTRKLARERKRDSRQAQMSAASPTAPSPPKPVESNLMVEMHRTSSLTPSPDPTADQELLDSLRALALTDSTSATVNQEPPLLKLDSPPDEPRLIVEVLVVRKLSLSEAFLDFEGFGLKF